ncbi:hypothetical protein [Pontibacter rugosus]|uniref:Uncharacterized protein n=1 Tax=Pontibacter rugosus TaxID=1745966 RepID=A0ABW3SUR6_9BACT
MRNNRDRYNDRDRHYGDFNRDYRNESNNYASNRFNDRVDRDAEGYPRYEPDRDNEFRQQGRHVGNHEDSYNEMYDTSNYADQPRPIEYGLPHAAENELDRVDYFPYAEGPYAGRERHYSYKTGYNANYDNPEEGDRYRDFDSRGNHGFRHDPGYGNEDSMREFANDHYGDRSRTSNRNYGYFGGYNR